MRAAVVVGLGGAALAACSSPPQRVIHEEVKPAIVVQIGHYDPSNTVPIVSDEIAFPVEHHSVPATIAHPTTGMWPAIVLMSGANPIDRNWNSPLFPGNNGSGKQLAETLAAHGAVVLRFDRAGVGGNNMPPDQITMDAYVDEAREALTVLRGRPNVDQHHLFVIGHDEGGLHAIRVAIAEGGRIAGVALLSAPGRTQRTITLAQVGARMKADVAAGKQSAEGAKAQMSVITAALDDFIEGRDVDPTKATELKAIQDPKTAKLARDMLGFDPGDGVGKLRVPVFILDGLKDPEIDPQLDGVRLQAQLKNAGQDVTLFLAPDANHVLKHETKTSAALGSDLAAIQAGYSAANIPLDDTAISALGNWIAAHDKE